MGLKWIFRATFWTMNRIESGREKVAEVSKKWFRIRDTYTYGVEVSPDMTML
jgi:uncharacterized protein YxjI